jgi:hypothetical protein
MMSLGSVLKKCSFFKNLIIVVRLSAFVLSIHFSYFCSSLFSANLSFSLHFSLQMRKRAHLPFDYLCIRMHAYRCMFVCVCIYIYICRYISCDIDAMGMNIVIKGLICFQIISHTVDDKDGRLKLSLGESWKDVSHTRLFLQQEAISNIRYEERFNTGD